MPRLAGLGGIESKEVRDDVCLITLSRQPVSCLDRAVIFAVRRPQLRRHQVRVIERGEGSVWIERTRLQNPLRGVFNALALGGSSIWPKPVYAYVPQCLDAPVPLSIHPTPASPPHSNFSEYLPEDKLRHHFVELSRRAL